MLADHRFVPVAPQFMLLSCLCAASLLEQLARKDETIWQLAQTQGAPSRQRAISGTFDDAEWPAKPPRLGARPKPPTIETFALREAGAMVLTPPKRKAGQNSYSVYKPKWDDGRPKAVAPLVQPPNPKLNGLHHVVGPLPQNGKGKHNGLGLKSEPMFGGKQQQQQQQAAAKKAQAAGKQAPADDRRPSNGSSVGNAKKGLQQPKKKSPKKAGSPPGRPGGTNGPGKVAPRAATASTTDSAVA
jgi:hypothetical protein